MISFGTSDAYVVRWVFQRALAVVWAIAFVSAWVQIDGLVGTEGIQPARDQLEAVRAASGGTNLRALPSLCWWIGADTRALHALCAAGTALAALLAAGVLPGLSSLALWVIYLSLTVVAVPFFNFQWDTLLLETGLLGALLVPWRWFAPGLAPDRPPSRTAMLLLRFLLFKLMLMSGLVKLTSGDPTWRGLTALEYHYWTTCLPTWTGWFAHQLPAWIHRASVIAMLFLEIAVPFLIFAPARRLRVFAFAAAASLQVAIAATGNYGFFNVLTLALCITVLDDEAIVRAMPSRLRDRVRTVAPHAWIAPWRQAPAVIAAVVIVPLSLLQMQARFLGAASLPAPALDLLRVAQPFRSVNGYGLFANMTTERLEIVVEGSRDGRTWRPYEFCWKPGDPARRPGFVQPHMPRLDWQMWFAALADWRTQPWFVAFLDRLLDGSPEVLGLLKTNPFSDGPPRFVRATGWDYGFTSSAERATSGDWWKRARRGLYCPVLTKVDGEIRAATLPPQS